MSEAKIKASVKVMLSYDYCHFEVVLASDQDLTLGETNELRKSAQRLADEAVRQYKIAKTKAGNRLARDSEKHRLEEQVKVIRQEPISEWSAEDKAKVKALDDDAYWTQHDYDYQDDEGVPF